MKHHAPRPNPSPEGEGLSLGQTDSPPLQGRGKGWGMNKARLQEMHTRARTLRTEATGPEKKLWAYLSGAKCGGFKFRRQAVVGPYIADFLCPQKALIIEVDGETHDVMRDAKRDAWLAAHGYQVLRVSNDDVLMQLDRVLDHIFQTVSQLPDRWQRNDEPTLNPSPTPNPSPEGEGGSLDFVYA
jgi:very-short-patch-repair endonuclease